MTHEKLKRSKLPPLLAIPAGAMALAGCGANYSGEGNEFIIHGKVTDPGKHSLKANIYEIDIADGEADGWFKIGTKHQIHDNCDCHGFWSSNKKYGVVYNLQGYETSPSQVAVGACVRFDGKIRADQEGKTTDDRPVYDVAQVEECPNGG
jgi:hypothetical protein